MIIIIIQLPSPIQQSANEEQWTTARRRKPNAPPQTHHLVLKEIEKDALTNQNPEDPKPNNGPKNSNCHIPTCHPPPFSSSSPTSCQKTPLTAD
jgi:hypothetical protein